MFQIGVVPCRIDILTRIRGIDFDSAWATRLDAEIEGIPVHFLGRAALIANKQSVARPKDLADVAALVAMEPDDDR